MIVALIGTTCASPIAPSGSRSVSVASGPYAADDSASRPRTETPVSGPIFCSSSSPDVRRFPKTKSAIERERGETRMLSTTETSGPSASDPRAPSSPRSGGTRLGPEF